MYKSGGARPNFDAVSLVSLEMTVPPVGGEPVLKSKFCYLDSTTGMTFGYLDLINDPTKGMTTLPPEVIAAWQKFQDEMEKFQGSIVFGPGYLVATEEGEPTTDSAVANRGLQIGIGGSY